jgi:hypothetical protein
MYRRASPARIPVTLYQSAFLFASKGVVSLLLSHILKRGTDFQVWGKFHRQAV